MYLSKIPKIIQRAFPEMLWKMTGSEKTIYLTFDDGPHPEITDWVLEQLQAYQAKASFFLIGKHVKAYPEIAHRILDQGHTIGNHTYDHLHGRKTDVKTYLKNFLKAQQTISEYTGHQTRLFRPPYGRLTNPQRYHINKSHRIVMMDVLSGDFDLNKTADACFHTVRKHSQPGSIVLFHDSEKAWPRLQDCLPKTLAFFEQEAYQFKALPAKDLMAKELL